MTVNSGIRPYQYIGTVPFRVEPSGEPIGFSGVLFSEAAFTLLADHRLFSTSGVVGTPFRLYINKGANISILIEPTASGHEYTSGCINYISYITDMRNELHAVCNAHSLDSCHGANVFRQDHLFRQHVKYPTRNNKGEYYRRESPGLNSIPSGEQLGASGLTDVDLAECQWQPFPRPSNSGYVLISTFNKWPIRPFFPAVIKPDGTIPDANDIDKASFDLYGINTYASGNLLLVTGDTLNINTRIKVLTASGSETPTTFSNAVTIFSGTEFPSNRGRELTGRLTAYTPPTVPITGVYLTAIDTFPVSSSGRVSHFPHNWESVNGTRVSNGSGQHDGLYIADRLMFNLQVAGQASIGRSLQNGRRVWGHTVGTEANSRGASFGAISFKDGTGGISASTSIFGSTTIVLADPPGPDNAITVTRKNHIWASADKLMSPVDFSSSTTDILGFPGAYFEDMTYGTINGDRGGVGVLGALAVNEGRGLFITQVGASQNGTLRDVNYTVYKFFIDGRGGITSLGSENKTQQVLDLAVHFDGFNVNSMILTGYKQICNVNGVCQYQFGSLGGASQRGRSFKVPSLDVLLYPRPPLVRDVFWGGSWRAGSTYLDRIVYTNQVPLSADVAFTTYNISISPSAGLPFSLTDVYEYGTPAWDQQTQLNYMYVQILPSSPVNPKYWFCKMDTNYAIIEGNPVDDGDYIGQGRNYIIDI